MSNYEEELSIWQDLLEDALNGKDEGLICPCGEDAPVEAEVDEYRIRLKCTKCGKYVEGIRRF